MKKSLEMLLELFRIIIICTFLGAIIWFILIENLYNIWNYSHEKDWIGALGIWVLLFVIYRNHLQFSGFYKSENQVKLSPIFTKVLVIISVIMILIPPLSSVYFS